MQWLIVAANAPKFELPDEIPNDGEIETVDAGAHRPPDAAGGLVLTNDPEKLVAASTVFAGNAAIIAATLNFNAFMTLSHRDATCVVARTPPIC